MLPSSLSSFLPSTKPYLGEDSQQFLEKPPKVRRELFHFGPQDGYGIAALGDLTKLLGQTVFHKSSDSTVLKESLE